MKDVLHGTGEKITSLWALDDESGNEWAGSENSIIGNGNFSANFNDATNSNLWIPQTFSAFCCTERWCSWEISRIKREEFLK